MTEPDEHVVKVARDLTEIVALAGQLGEQALHQGRSRLMPGGRATVALGHVGSPDEWAELIAAEEFRHLARCPKSDHRACSYADQANDEDEYDEPPLQTLLFWSEAWRSDRGYQLDKRPTITSEVGFLRGCLTWAWENELHWDDFAKDIRAVRVRLESVLYAGKRIDLTRVECDQCAASPRLIRLLGGSEDGQDDRWKCPGCKHRFDRSDMLRAHGRQLMRETAAKFVEQGDAVGTLKAQGRSENTIRKWLAPLTPKDRCEVCGETWRHQEFPACPSKVSGDECGGLLHTVWVGDREAIVEAYCEIGSRRRFVWWPDLWRLHLTTQTRRPSQSA